MKELKTVIKNTLSEMYEASTPHGMDLLVSKNDIFLQNKGGRDDSFTHDQIENMNRGGEAHGFKRNKDHEHDKEGVTHVYTHTKYGEHHIIPVAWYKSARDRAGFKEDTNNERILDKTTGKQFGHLTRLTTGEYEARFHPTGHTLRFGTQQHATEWLHLKNEFDKKERALVSTSYTSDRRRPRN